MSLVKAISHQIGMAADAAKNFIFSASAQDGSMTLKRENGQEVMLVDSQGKVIHPQNVQTWTTPSRVKDTTYTNSEKLPIKVSASVIVVSGSIAQLIVGGVVMATAVNNNTANITVQLYGEVPAGATYRLNQQSGTITVVGFAELS